MTRLAAVSLLAAGLIVSAAALTATPAHAPDVALTIPFDLFPESLGAWTGAPGAPEDVLPSDRRGVPEHLLRTYRKGGETVWVSVGYYPSLPEGRRPATQQLLYPDKGWADVSSRSVSIPLAEDGGRAIDANLVLMRSDRRQVAVVYWFQVAGDVFASDHRYRLRLLYNRLVHRRNDMALIRVAAPVSDAGGPEGARDSVASFVREFHPALLRSLPR